MKVGNSYGHITYLHTGVGGGEVVRRLFGIEMRQYYCAAAAGWFVLGTIFLPSFPVVVSFTRFLKRQFIFILPLKPFSADFPDKSFVKYSRNLSNCGVACQANCR